MTKNTENYKIPLRAFDDEEWGMLDSMYSDYVRSYSILAEMAAELLIPKNGFEDKQGFRVNKLISNEIVFTSPRHKNYMLYNLKTKHLLSTHRRTDRKKELLFDKIDFAHFDVMINLAHHRIAEAARRTCEEDS